MQTLLNALDNDSPLGLIILDCDRRVKHMNRCMIRWTDSIDGQWMNRDFFALFPGLDKSIFDGPPTPNEAQRASENCGKEGRGLADIQFELQVSDRRLYSLLSFSLMVKEPGATPCHAIFFCGPEETSQFHRGFVRAMAQAFDHRQADWDSAALQQTAWQNVTLQDANATLEARVREHTAQLAQSTELLDVAHADLKRSYVVATEVFSSLINQRLPENRQTNREVIALVQAFCKEREFPQKLTDDLTLAAGLYNIGQLTWNDALIELLPEEMDKEQRERYRDYPVIGESLLMALEPAQEAATFIRHHQERWDGGGFPDGLVGQSIPLGARILKMAVDLVEMQRGMVLSRKLSREEALSSMVKYSLRLYDPLLCQEFIKVAETMGRETVAETMDNETAQEEDVILALATMALMPGMVMARNLHAESGMLLLKKDTVLTERFIEKLCAFEENEGTKYTLHVHCPQPDNADE